MTEFDSISENNLAIKAICVISFINATQMINLIFSPMSKQAGAIYPTYFAISVIVSFVCLFGLWLQKKWAATIYIILLIFNQIVLLKMGYWEVTALIIPFIITGTLIKFKDKFS